ncbi:MAG: hypothetical protein HY875_14690 [Chloroflexi bacterium]|nr:hypothetical protein [Chloroflexota bacterium]
MSTDPATTTLDQDVRRYVYDQAIKLGLPPSIAETAAAVSATPAEVEASFRRLADARMLVLQRDSGEVLMANPFSAVPTAFVAEVDGQEYYGNCIWDVMGIPAMLGRDANIRASCGDCGTAMPLAVRDGALQPAQGIVHFAIPAAQWWRDIVFN